MRDEVGTRMDSRTQPKRAYRVRNTRLGTAELDVGTNTEI